jgi:small subunit ribosomal protein S16
MPTKIRLARHGRKSKPFYYIVVADSKAPRDGKFIERIGSYNPNTNPATIELDFDKALSWVRTGAQPTDTCRTILSHKGVMFKLHLLKGVSKGALTLEQVEMKFETWAREKEIKIAKKKASLLAKAQNSSTARLKEETEISKKRAEELAKKHSQLNKQLAENSTEETTEE